MTGTTYINGSAITHRYDFENDLTDAVGGETLTGVSLDASNYIAS